MTIAGTILRINLTDGNVEKTPTAPYVKDYIGGLGVAARIFWEEVPPEARAFSPENLLIFSAGALTGTLLGNKGEVITKTPEQANNPLVHIGFGGQFPSEMKLAGYDNIVIKGQAGNLVYIYINNDDVEIIDAQHLKGLDVHETQRRIKQELGDPDIQVACIGPAGENRVVCAMVVNDIGNSASKRGTGAVMGFKNLKAVAVRGTKGLKIADPKAFLALYDEFYNDLTKGRAAPYARIWHNEGMSRMHIEGYAHMEKDSLPAEVPPSPTLEFMHKAVVGHTGCAFCPLQCHHNLSVPGIGNGEAMCVVYWGMVYCNLYEKYDFNLWWKRSVLCEKLGVDHLYVEMLGDWLIELYKNGIITAEDTDGIPMVKGSEKAVTALIEKLARAEGFGKLLTDGVVPAACKLGKGSLDFANQYGNAATYLTPTGMDHGVPNYLGKAAKFRPGDFETSAPFPGDAYAAACALADILEMPPREAVERVIDVACDVMSERITGDKNVWRAKKYDPRQNLITADQEDSTALSDILGHCEYVSDWYGVVGCLYGNEDYARWLSAATGTQYSTDEVRKVAYRVRMLIDSYRVLGSLKLGEEHITSKRLSPAAPLLYPGSPEEQKKRAEDFCLMRGYDLKTGIPTRKTLEKLGLKEVADRLEAVISTGTTGFSDSQK